MDQSGEQGQVASASAIAFGKTRNQRGIGQIGLLPGQQGLTKCLDLQKISHAHVN
ncbi:hypothetical protein [Aquaspirillum sp. LM1]|uniref:hypothetical protein n=1 Tax=Aquaspirillum sp. LM1 TaxID=1938604 RepID=UPI0015C57B0A